MGRAQSVGRHVPTRFGRARCLRGPVQSLTNSRPAPTPLPPLPPSHAPTPTRDKPPCHWLNSITSCRYGTAQHALELVNRRGWEAAWGSEAPVPPLGIGALILNHEPDERRASTEKMVRALGFGPVDFPSTTSASSLHLPQLEAEGLVARNWTWAFPLKEHIKLRYIAHALDYRNVLLRARDEAAGGGLAQWLGVFEDDLFVPTRPSIAATRVRDALREVPHDADLVYLEWCHDECGKALYHLEKPNIKRTMGLYCSAAILFSAQGVQRTVDVLAVIDAPIDDMLKAACRPGGSLTCYALRQPVFVQDLLWGSAVSSTKTRTHYHDIYMTALLCRHVPLEIEWSLWTESLAHGHGQGAGKPGASGQGESSAVAPGGFLLEHPADAGPVYVRLERCGVYVSSAPPARAVRWGQSAATNGLHAEPVLGGVLTGLVLRVDGLFAGVEYILDVAVPIQGPSPGSARSQTAWAGRIAVNPGETGLDVEVEVPLGGVTSDPGFEATVQVRACDQAVSLPSTRARARARAHTHTHTQVRVYDGFGSFDDEWTRGEGAREALLGLSRLSVPSDGCAEW